jgi:DNA-binding response OmpR family regulator
MEEMSTLVVDDDANIRLFLEDTLQKIDHSVTAVESGEKALAMLRDNFFDLAIVDLHLGGRVDGLRLLEAIKWRWPQTIVIILTGYGSLESALAAIREGVDDYLLKPVEPEEVQKAVRAALARQGRLVENYDKISQVVQCGSFTVDREMHQIAMNEELIELTPREFKLLAHLIMNADHVVSPRELVEVAQGYDCNDDQEARDIVKWYVYRLRRKIEPEPSNPQYILNVRGVGYTFCPNNT